MKGVSLHAANRFQLKSFFLKKDQPSADKKESQTNLVQMETIQVLSHDCDPTAQSVTHLLVLAVSAGRVDVEGRGVEAADVGRSFTGRVDHVQLRKQGDVTQVAGVVDRSVAPAADGRTRRLLVLQQLLASELAAGLQLRHEPHFLRIPLRPPHRVLALAEFLLLALQPRQSGQVTGHSI